MIPYRMPISCWCTNPLEPELKTDPKEDCPFCKGTGVMETDGEKVDRLSRELEQWERIAMQAYAAVLKSQEASKRMKAKLRELGVDLEEV